MRLSLAVALLVVSLSSCSTSAFGTPAHSLVSKVRTFGVINAARPTTASTPTTPHDARRNVAFCRNSICTTTRGGGSCPLVLQASLLSEGVVLAANLDLLSERGRAAVTNLIEHDDDGAQKHVYADWPEPGTDDEGKRRLAEQVCSSVIGSLHAHTHESHTIHHLEYIVWNISAG